MASTKRRQQFHLILTLSVLFVGMAIVVRAEEGNGENSPDQGIQELDKRYIAALAKNGRLPQFRGAQKKGQQSGDSTLNEETDFQRELSEETPGDLWLEDKRHIGAFLKAHGRPYSKNYQRQDRSPTLYDDDESDEDVDSLSSSWSKRNVASLARLGRLNAIRYGRFRPNDSGKRISYEEMNDAANANDEESEIDAANDSDCDDDESQEGDDDNAQSNWVLKKRYVAALARSGRLPIWHPQRMWWGGKRDTPSPYWMRSRSGARPNSDKRDDVVKEIAFAKPKNKRCKKMAPVEEKRNLAAMARNGKLPFRSNVSA